MNNRQQEIWHNLLANPANAEDVDIAGLRELIDAYPQSGLLRACYGQVQGEKDPQLAGAYFDGAALHKLFYQAGSLLPVNNHQVVAQADANGAAAFISSPSVKNIVPEDYSPSEPVFYQKDPDNDVLTDQPPGFPGVLNISLPNYSEEEVVINSQPDLLPDAYASIAETPQEAEQPAPLIQPEHQAEYQYDPEEVLQPAIVPDGPVTPEEAIMEHHEVPEANIAPEEPQALLPEFDPAADLPESPIEDEVFEEITGIDEIEIAKPTTQLPDEAAAPAEAL